MAAADGEPPSPAAAAAAAAAAATAATAGCEPTSYNTAVGLVDLV